MELEEVPSDRFALRGLCTEIMVPRFEQPDAEKQLGSGRTVVLQGIDEESARRILATFKAMKAPGILSRDQSKDDWMKRLWNPGAGPYRQVCSFWR